MYSQWGQTPAAGGYGAPPAQPGYGAPPPAQAGYGAPPPGTQAGYAGYGAPPAAGGAAPGAYQYPGSAPAPSSPGPGGYGSAPAAPAGGYGAAPTPTAPGGYGTAPAQAAGAGGYSAYGAPPNASSQGGYGGSYGTAPPGGYSTAPPGQQGPAGGGSYAYQQQQQLQQQQSGYSVAPPAPAGAPPAPQQPADPNKPSPEVLRVWFDSIDKDKSGNLDAKEIQSALEKGNLRYSVSDCDAMVRAFDTKGTRTLSFDEFSRLHAFLTTIQESFSKYCKPGTNELPKSGVKTAMDAAGFALEEPVVAAMVNRYDVNSSQSMSLDEFIRMCLFFQSCVRAFSAFDEKKVGRITLDFNQFVYAAAHTT